jgi:branched-chain amino acid transport system permease protein
MTATMEALERPVAAVRSVFAHRIAGPVLKVVLGYLLLVEGVVQAIFGRIDIPFIEIGFIELGRKSAPIPRGTFIGGLVIGALYAMFAIGLILVYRANRIINFAQAQLGAVPAVIALLLIARKGWPWFSVLPIVVIGSIVLGAGVEVAFIRRFNRAPRLILTVVTIGVGFLLLVLEFFSKLWISGDLLQSSVAEFNTPFKDIRWRMGIATLNGDQLFGVIVVAAVVVALGAFFKFTDMGIAVRASAENGERASLLGIPVNRVSMVVWSLAALLSAIGVFLRVPIVGLPLDGFIGPSLLLYGLAAAVIARMESLPTALFAGMFIGIVDRAAIFSTNRASIANAVMFVVILVALLVQRGSLSRAADTGVSTWQAVKEFRPIPAELRSVPDVVTARLVVSLVVGAIILGLPFIVGDLNTGAATKMLVFAMVGVSLVILTGWAGQISLGQFAISGIGAAVAGGLAANHGWDFFATIFVAGIAGALVAVVIGLPAVRIQGLFLAVITLSFAFTVANFVLTREFFGWLMPKEGLAVERPIMYGRFDLNAESKLGPVTFMPDAKLYYVTLAFLVVILASATALRKNRSGRILIGVRDNGKALQAYGVNLARTRLVAFAISGFIAAVAGALFAYQQTSVDAGTYGAEYSIQLFVMTVIGGIGSLAGALLGAAFVVGLPLLPILRDIDIIEFLTSGIGVVVILYFMPGGLAEGMYRIRDTFLRRVAAKHSIHVPSLIADSLVDQHEQEAEEDVILTADHQLLEATADSEVELIGCPACGARMPIAEVALHAHFRVDGDGEAPEPESEYAPARRGE